MQELIVMVNEFIENQTGNYMWSTTLDDDTNIWKIKFDDSSGEDLWQLTEKSRKLKKTKTPTAKWKKGISNKSINY